MTKLDIERELMETNFMFFVKLVFRLFYEKAFEFYEFHRDLTDKLVNLEPGARVVLNAPPRIGKTVLIQLLIAWYLFKSAKATIIYVCYEERLAAAKNREIKQIVQWLADRYGIEELKLDPQAQGKTHWITKGGGGVMARGSKNGITGFGADSLLVVDDPNKPEDRSSASTLELRNRVFYNTVRNRINSPEVPIIVIQQRVASNDLSGYLLNADLSEKWVHYCYPAIKDDGKALCPERLPIEEIEKYKSDPFTYNAQYLQQPLDDVGRLFDKNKLILSIHRPPVNALKCVISVDAASKGDVGNDYNAIAVIGTDCKNFYVLDVLNFHADISVLLQRIRDLRKKWGANIPILIEAKANGTAAIQVLRKETSGVLEVNPSKDKLERAIMVKYLFDAMNVSFAVRGLVWGEIQQQFTQFPHVKHDDIVDAVVQGITWLQKIPSRTLLESAGKKPTFNLNRPTYGGGHGTFRYNPTSGR